jgi:hypothetical protein
MRSVIRMPDCTVWISFLGPCTPCLWLCATSLYGMADICLPETLTAAPGLLLLNEQEITCFCFRPYNRETHANSVLATTTRIHLRQLNLFVDYSKTEATTRTFSLLGDITRSITLCIYVHCIVNRTDATNGPHFILINCNSVFSK